MDYPTLIAVFDEILSRKDIYPNSHHGRSVASLSLKIAAKMQDINTIQLETAARVHDVGKVMVDDALLNAPRRLTSTEQLKVHEHSTMGSAILRAIGVEEDICRAVECHHEHWDGSGYPHNLRGVEIPILARLICISDVWDALTSARAYRRAMSEEQALVEMNLCSRWFDPRVYAAFLETLRDGC